MTKKALLSAWLLCALALAPLGAQQPPQPPRLDALKKQAVAEVDKLQTFTQQMVDQIFSYAELGFQEAETSRYLASVLEKNGFRVERGIAGIPTAWVATYGAGKPVIGFITDIDCIPRASQKPGVAYHDPIVEGAPGHGEGHNSGMAVNLTAALVLKKLMDEHKLSGTLKIFPGVAEEILGTKAFYVRAASSRTWTRSSACTWTTNSRSNMASATANGAASSPSSISSMARLRTPPGPRGTAAAPSTRSS